MILVYIIILSMILVYIIILSTILVYIIILSMILNYILSMILGFVAASASKSQCFAGSIQTKAGPLFLWVCIHDVIFRLKSNRLKTGDLFFLKHSVYQHWLFYSIVVTKTRLERAEKLVSGLARYLTLPFSNIIDCC